MKLNAWKKKRAVILKRDGNDCIYCRKPLTLDVPNNHSSQVTLEHIIPQSDGGNHLITNLTIACGACNSKRGSSDFFCFLRRHTRDNEVHYKYQYLLTLGENLTCIMETIKRVSKSTFIREGSAVEYLNRTADEMNLESDRLDFEKIVNRCSESSNTVLPFKELCYLLWRVNIDVRTLAENVK